MVINLGLQWLLILPVITFLVHHMLPYIYDNILNSLLPLHRLHFWEKLFAGLVGLPSPAAQLSSSQLKLLLRKLDY